MIDPGPAEIIIAFAAQEDWPEEVRPVLRPRRCATGFGDSLDNALAESIIGLYKTEVIRTRGP